MRRGSSSIIERGSLGAVIFAGARLPHKLYNFFGIGEGLKTRVTKPLVAVPFDLALFHQRLQSSERLVPLRRDAREASLRLEQRLRLELPDALAPRSMIAYETRAREHAQMLGDRLPRDAGAGRETHNRHRLPGREAGDDEEACLVAERGEERSRARDARGPRWTPTSPRRHTG
jgi:hypothetical protein